MRNIHMKSVVLVGMIGLLGALSSLSAQATGRITGRIVDQQTGEPAFGVVVTVQGVPGAVGQTDFDGKYSIQAPAGTYQVSFQAVGYAPQTRQVTVVAGQTSNTNLTMGVVLAQEVVVQGRSISNTEASMLAMQRKSATVSDGISQEAIRRSPDSSAGDVLRRVTGVTLVGGKFVFVRGLGERYSNTVLNGAGLASPEPDKRVVPMDLFPASLIKNIQVIKTFLPEDSGDFSGGIVKVETQEFPDEFVLTMGGGFGYRSGVTRQQFRTYEGGGQDYLGKDDGTRDRPAFIESLPQFLPWVRGNRFGGIPEEAVQLSSVLFPQTFDPQTINAPYDRNLSFSVGDSVEETIVGKFGYLVGSSYARQWKRTDAVDNDYVSINPVNQNFGEFSFLSPAIQARTQTWTEEVLWGNNVNLAIEPSPNHRFASKTFYSRSSEKFVLESSGLGSAQGVDPFDFQSINTGWVGREVIHSTLNGQHVVQFSGLRPHKVEWTYASSVAKRDEPNLTQQVFVKEAGRIDIPSRASGTGTFRFYSETEDKSDSLNAAYELPFEQWDGLLAKLKLGGLAVRRVKDYEQDIYNYLQTGNGSDLDRSVVPASISLLEGVATSRFRFQEQTGLFDTYNAYQNLHAYFAQVDLPITADLRFIGGLRYEDSFQRVKTYNSQQPFGQELDLAQPGIGVLKNRDRLPSANLVWEFVEDMNLRLAYTETVNRPDFRDLSSAGFQTSFTGERVFGNPDLKRAYLHNYDARWEWYLTGEEYLGVGAFLKTISNPVERIGIATANNEREYTFINASEGEIRGLEFEFRKDFLEYFNFTTNFFLIDSYVEVLRWEDKTAIALGLVPLSSRRAIYSPTNLERPLEGQSPYVANFKLSFYFDSDKSGSLGLLYNLFDDRLRAGGANGAPDFYENGAATLDLVYEQKFGDSLTLKAAAKNITNTKFEIYQESPLFGQNQTVSSYREGTSYTASLGYKF